MTRSLLPLALGLLVPSVLSARQVTVDGRLFTLPDGFQVEKVTTTNQVLRPVNACFDDQGRLYVTDASGSSAPPAEQAKDPRWRVMRLEDTDHDGVFDKAQVFADHLPMLQGILWHQGVVYVGGTPAIWKLIDKDGDGRADERVEWWNVGRPSTHCGNEVHGPYAGPDGFIYWTKGAFEPIAWTNGVTGQVHLDRGAHIFRARPDGSEFDSIMTGGMDNPVEVAFTADGECLFTSTFIDFSRPEYRDGLGHAIYGGVYGKHNSNVEDRAVKRTSPELLHPFVEFGAAAPSGLCRYTQDGFGTGYRDNFFASLFNMHKITRHEVRPSGATFTAATTDFLATEDTDFHPTDVLESPDGCLIVADTGGWYKLCCPTSQLWKPDVLGCLYRISRIGAPRVASRPATAAPKPAVRKGSLEGWKDRVVAAKGEPFAVHAVTEALIRLASPADLREAMGDRREPVQSAALTALAERDGSDLKSSEVTPLLTGGEGPLRTTAEWVLQRRTEWAPEIVAWARTRLEAWSREGQAGRFAPLLPLFTRDSEGQGVVAECARRSDLPASLRQAAFDTMARSGARQPPAPWRDAVEQALGNSVAAATPEGHAMVASALRVAGQMKEAPTSALNRLASDAGAPVDLRLEALASRPGGTSLSESEFQLALAQLKPQAAPALRASAVRILGRGALGADQRRGLAGSLREVGPLEIGPLLGAFEGIEDAALGHELVKALSECKARGALRPDLLRPCLGRLPAENKAEVEALMSLVAPDGAAQARRIDTMLQELKSLTTDIRRGQAVFNSTKAACVQCHQIGYAGGEVGPNLTKIGEVRSERDLLEAVVYPSASFVRSYEPLVLITRDGDLLTGIPRDETDTALTLITGPGAAAEKRVSKADIAEQRPGAVSLMPAGLDEQLSRQELADLVAFLKNTHWGVK